MYWTHSSIRWLTINVVKTRMMAIKTIQPRHYFMFTYKREPIQMMQSFKYLGTNVLSTNRWNLFYTCLRIDATKVILEDGK